MSLGEIRRLRTELPCAVWNPLGYPMTKALLEAQAVQYARWLAQRNGIDLSKADVFQAQWRREHVGEGARHRFPNDPERFGDRAGQVRYQSPPPYKALFIESVKFGRAKPQWHSWDALEMDTEIEIVVVEIPNPDPREISCINCSELSAA